jgi:hypothetical protein
VVRLLANKTRLLLAALIAVFSGLLGGFARRRFAFSGLLARRSSFLAGAGYLASARELFVHRLRCYAAPLESCIARLIAHRPAMPSDTVETAFSVVPLFGMRHALHSQVAMHE